MQQSKPIKKSLYQLSQYPRFSTVERMDTRFYESNTEACKDIAQEIKETI